MRNLSLYWRPEEESLGERLYVYLEDPEGSSLIRDLPCVLLGELQPGQEQSFAISQEAAALFVLEDPENPELPVALYPLSAGEEDLHLEGQLVPDLQGCPVFCFDGAEAQEESLLQEVSELLSEEAPAETLPSDAELVYAIPAAKKKKFNPLWVILPLAVVGILAAAIIVLLSILGGGTDFSCDGMTITLDKSFEEVPDTGFAGCFESPETAVFVLREDFSLMPGLEDFPLEEYASLVLQNNQVGTDTQLQNKDGLYWFEYDFDNLAEGKTYHFYVYTFKSADAFWLVQFATPVELAEAQADDIEKWVGSVSFDAPALEEAP